MRKQIKQLTTSIAVIGTALSIGIISITKAQNVGISATGVIPNADAGLDINFTDKGLLIPRVNLTSLTTFNPPITSGGNTTSLLVYNTNTTIGVGYYYWDGTKWVKLLVSGNPSDAWLTLGNTGTNPATHFIGTTDNTSLVFRTNNIERMRLHSSGQLSIGDNTPGGKLDVHQENNNDVARFITYGSTNNIRLRRTQGTKTSPSATSGANTILGRIYAEGYNGSGFTPAAAIEMSTDATGGTSSDMPGRIAFWTTPDGSGTLQERMRITNNGNVGIGTTNPVRMLHIQNTSGVTGAAVSVRTENYWSFIEGYSANNTSNQTNTFIGLRGRNTLNSPAYPQAGDFLSEFLGRDMIDGYTSSAFGGGGIHIVAEENFSNTAKGTQIRFTTTSIGSVIPTNKMIITANGNVGIGTMSPASPAILDVNSSNKGVIFPRIGLTSATDNASIPGVIDGIMVYNTATAGSGNNAITPGYYYWQNNRWNKFQTNGYAGVIFGVHNPTTPNHLTAIAPSTQYTGSYIDLPPGKWIVYIYELISPNDAGINNWDGSPFDKAIWVRCTLSNSDTFFSTSSDIIGPPLASGALVAPCGFGMVTGAIYIYNSSGSTKRYYLWANMNQYNTTCGAYNFAANYWGENQFFAVPAE